MVSMEVMHSRRSLLQSVARWRQLRVCTTSGEWYPHLRLFESIMNEIGQLSTANTASSDVVRMYRFNQTS